MIKVENLSFSYDETILSNLTFNIDKNKITLIIGKNGTGKSTLSYLLSGIINKFTGTIVLDDLKLNSKTNKLLLRNKIGIVFQNPSNQILFTNVYEDIKFTLDNLHTPSDKINQIIKDVLKKVDMLDYINDNPYNLSGGQQQRIAIASAISTQPDYLILDESTSMLDSIGKKDIYKLLQELKKEMGIIFITNNINELQYADDVIILDNKKAYKYEINEIIKKNSILTKHNIDIPFIFKIAKKLGIKDIKDITEKNLLSRIK